MGDWGESRERGTWCRFYRSQVRGEVGQGVRTGGTSTTAVGDLLWVRTRLPKVLPRVENVSVGPEKFHVAEWGPGSTVHGEIALVRGRL